MESPMESTIVFMVAVVLPAVAIGGGLAYAALKMLTDHRAKVVQMQQDEARRREEREDAIVGVGGQPELVATLQLIEARLDRIEQRLQIADEADDSETTTEEQR